MLQTTHMHVFRAHTHSFTGTALATHTHRAAVILATEVAADSITFVGLADGGAVDTGANISHAGGAAANIDVPTDAISGGTPAGTTASVRPA